MSELTNMRHDGRLLRWRLLATVSALALLGFTRGTGVADASDDDADRPVVWIELGGQFDVFNGSQQKLNPPFFVDVTNAGFESPLKLEHLSAYGLGESAKISFTPQDSDWAFSASVRYGRNSSKGYRHQQTNRPLTGIFASAATKVGFRYAGTTTSNAETYDIFDFMAGKDVGLGSLGLDGTSILSGGFRFVQFQSKSSLAVYTDPDYVRNGPGIQPKYFHNFSAHSKNDSSFSGIGPAISWDASTPLGGNTQDGQITFDWGLNGAVSFGRQRSRGSHQTNGKFSSGLLNIPPQFYLHTSHYTHGPYAHDRSRMVAVPNLGAMAGLSFHYANAKVSFGYRIDEFFGAMDGGIDVHKNYNFGDSGPFVNVSIGLGR